MHASWLALALSAPAWAASARGAAAETAAATAAARVPADAGYSLVELERLLLAGSAALVAEQARVLGAEAGLRAAAARPNPEVELLAGQVGARLPGVNAGGARGLAVTQPLEWASLRQARREAADAGLDSARALAQAARADLLAQLRLRYHEVLLREAERRAALEDLALANQIRDRVGARVDTGESPRYELFRADSERSNAQRRADAASLRITQAQAELRRLIGPALPERFALAGSLEEAAAAPPDAQTLRSELLARHPLLLAARAELRAAEARLAQERSRSLPAVALRGAVDREPDTRSVRAGVVVTVPLFDRRAGPIAEAEAELQRRRAELADRELQLTQALAVAVQQHGIAAGQVLALEGGIVRDAEAAMRVAQAAYRFGERGILDYLDAQRSLRQVRNDLNQARYELRAALVELERLRGIQP